MISDTEKRILQCLYVFPFLTVQQVRRLLMFHSSSYASTKFRALWMKELIQRRSLPSAIRAGSVPWIYALTRSGRSYLRRSGYNLRYHPYPSEVFAVEDYDNLRHDLAVTDFLIAGYLLAKQYPAISLIEMLHDRTLRAMQQSPAVFDGWLNFLVRGGKQQCIALEYERREKDVKAFERKIMALLNFIVPNAQGKSPYETQFHTASLTISFVTPISLDYTYTLKQRIETILKVTEKVYEADVFRLLYLPPGEVDPATFLTASWLRPFTDQKMSLIAV
ncbi:hypothetical protein KSF_084060 [Reticulibacter mediterranei]|uniref:Uncharacterized protein n=1 Tax=Reticulibacter mediterranei TaxID=2778369 RepID=A0A8J3IQH5_9CHLR|nr:replication-relaxation family protein [Reticulibacter mediterranei]GHO98358.1 hypothetical protein KSF_084060 [Reticulibacter mediterranei]